MTRPAGDEAERALARLHGLVQRTRQVGWSGLTDEELELFPRLYRRVSTLVAEQETAGQDEARLRARRALLLEAHTLYRSRSGGVRQLLRAFARLYLVEVPRTVRAEWKLVASSFALIYAAPSSRVRVSTAPISRRPSSVARWRLARATRGRQ